MKSKYHRSFRRRDAVVSRSQCIAILNTVGFLYKVPYNSLYESIKNVRFILIEFLDFDDRLW